MEIWTVRHGATEWSKNGRHTGSTDLPLLPEGSLNAVAAGAFIGQHLFTRVLSSPLGRARETARLAGFGDRLEITDLLLEYDYGDYEGVTTKEIHATSPGWELFRDGCPGGESPQDIAGRMDRLIDSIGEPDGDVLLFGHGHCLRALGARWVARPIELAGLLCLDAGSVSILGHEHDHRAISRWNQSCLPLGDVQPA